jgi:hypothetical protein
MQYAFVHTVFILVIYVCAQQVLLADTASLAVAEAIGQVCSRAYAIADR